MYSDSSASKDFSFGGVWIVDPTQEPVATWLSERQWTPGTKRQWTLGTKPAGMRGRALEAHTLRPAGPGMCGTDTVPHFWVTFC